jgi:uncharacterized membrane protein YfbV (UPF0208 family)
VHRINPENFNYVKKLNLRQAVNVINKRKDRQDNINIWPLEIKNTSINNEQRADQLTMLLATILYCATFSPVQKKLEPIWQPKKL